MSTLTSLQIPMDERTVRSLKLGDNVLLTGRIFTARDAAHGYIVSHAVLEPPCPDLQNGVIYHCGPVIVKRDGQWVVTAAGPTTSSREEPYEAAVIRRFRLKAIIGKGGMGPDTAAACKECGCVYLQATGGAAQVLAAAVHKVEDVFYYDKFGAPEAIWVFDVKDFPATVTMDADGNSLHQRIKDGSAERLKMLLQL